MQETIVLYPSSSVGHLISMVELGKLILHHHPPHHRFPFTFFDMTPTRSRAAMAFEFNHLNHRNIRSALQEISKTSTVRAFIIDLFCTSAFSIANGIISNTFDGLEPVAMKAIFDGVCFPDNHRPSVHYIGPLIAETHGEDHLQEPKETASYLLWPDKQRVRSVVFLCFGSRGSFSALQDMGMAIGVEEREEDGFVSGDELERGVRELMESEKGREMSERSRKMKEMAMAVFGDSCWSTRALASFVAAIE
ncbi:hypothetical protein FEM48_Zijuj06G0182400 [Ziziphus jujuba var. spinosa]|uniref:Uncharacterized protein n=1 Tax=Ziziphus jujuba var. spinosa TaxID=714518 RepID=A0A978VAV1_ZIZJJ|nr:hypothetical protein FEM48_Zijuj06G0182400 [Ziziphus jujuba var. spinosa]